MASTQKFEVEATVRSVLGKGASRRLRRQEKVPGVVYGGGKEAVSLTFEHKNIAKALKNEAFYSHIITLKTHGSGSERVILKDVQRHPYKALIKHIDFQRIRADEKIHMHVPLHFVGAENAPGVKEGGVVSHIMSDLEISCLPDNLPEYIELDISSMELNKILHISDIKLPKGVESVALAHDNDKPVVSIHMPRIEVEPVVEEAVEVAPSEVPAMAQKSDEEIAAEEAAKEGKKEKK
jgi:large subunit ribosomal protein L25